MSHSMARSGAPRSHVSRSTVEAHRRHTMAPFFGCPLCVRPAPFKGPALRWSSPRLG